MNYFTIDQRNFWCGIGYLDNPPNLQNALEYNDFLEYIYPGLLPDGKQRKLNSIPDFFPELDFFQVSSGILPKYIYITGGDLPRGFIIKRSLYKNLVNLISIAPHITSEIKLTYRKKINEEFYYCFFKDITDNIDYKNSIFKGYVKISDDYEYFRAESLSDLLLKSKEKYNFSSYYDKVKFKADSTQYDIFGLFHIDLNIYFSEKVKEIFQNLKIKEEFKDAGVKFEY